LRITVGNEQENEILLTTLQAFEQNGPASL